MSGKQHLIKYSRVTDDGKIAGEYHSNSEKDAAKKAGGSVLKEAGTKEIKIQKFSRSPKEGGGFTRFAPVGEPSAYTVTKTELDPPKVIKKGDTEITVRFTMSAEKVGVPEKVEP
jgi:hypothetical protein